MLTHCFINFRSFFKITSVWKASLHSITSLPKLVFASGDTPAAGLGTTSFPSDLSTIWNPETKQMFQNFFSWDWQRIQNWRPLSPNCSCPCTWSPSWETFSSSRLSSLTSNSTLPCTSFSPVCPLLTSVSAPPWSQRSWRTSKHRIRASLVEAASPRSALFRLLFVGKTFSF